MQRPYLRLFRVRLVRDAGDATPAPDTRRHSGTPQGYFFSSSLEGSTKVDWRTLSDSLSGPG